MAEETFKKLRNMTVYQVYVRNHTAEGTFKALEADLDRIQNLGVDMVYLLPVHPIGTQNRKGSLGSPYAIVDYRSINPELGTAEDFQALVSAIHRRGMKCIMDVVYNHTSPDSTLAREHPEWFYRKPGGGFGNKIGDWWDVIDLDYTNPASGLWDYLIETLLYWAEMVDGFRCDVAPLVPLAFWLRAREAAAKVNPHCIWIAESAEPPFILENRSRGLVCHTDAELYRAFDVCYDYDVFGAFKQYLEGSLTLASWVEHLSAQEYIYPDNYVKLRFLENHDQSRAAFSIPGRKALRNWTAFLYFQKGLTMIYGGQEWENDFRPSLFDKDPIHRSPVDGEDISPLLRNLYRIKQDPVFADSSYELYALNGSDDALLALHRPKRTSTGGAASIGGAPLTGGFSPDNTASIAGLFSLKGKSGPVCLDGMFTESLEGIHTNLIDGSSFRIEGGRISLRGEPLVFKF